jgi:hypothetical protein
MVLLMVLNYQEMKMVLLMLLGVGELMEEQLVQIVQEI